MKLGTLVNKEHLKRGALGIVGALALNHATPAEALTCAADEKEIAYYLSVDPVADRLPGGSTFLNLPGLEEGAPNSPATPEWIDSFNLLELPDGSFVREVITIDYKTETFIETPLTNPVVMRHNRNKELIITDDGILLNACQDQNTKGGITNNIYFDNNGALAGFFTNPWHDLGGYALGSSTEATTIALAKEFNTNGGDAETFLKLAEHYTGVPLTDRNFSEDAITMFQVGVTKSDTRAQAQVSNEDDAYAEGNNIYRTKTGGTVHLGPGVNEVRDKNGTIVAANRVINLDNYLNQTLNFHTIDGIKNVYIGDGIGNANINMTCNSGIATITGNALFNVGEGRTLEHEYELYKNGTLVTNTEGTNFLTNDTCNATYELRSYKRSPQGNKIPGMKETLTPQITILGIDTDMNTNTIENPAAGTGLVNVVNAECDKPITYNKLITNTPGTWNGTTGPITIDANGLLTGTPTGTDCGTTHNETYNVTNGTNDSVNVQIAVGAAINTETDAIIYVDKWAKQVINLNNREIRAMINGDGGTRSYAHDMAQIFFNHTPGIPFDVDFLEQSLYDYADGSNLNDEFYTGFDPFSYTFNGDPDNIVALYDARTNGNSSTNFRMDDTGMILMKEIISGISETTGPVDGFLRWYVRANPQLYGGQVGGTVDINTDPTWLTQDPNP